MKLINEFFPSWMQDSIGVRTTTRDAYGERVLGATTTLTGRVRYVNKVLRKANGETKPINYIVYLPYGPTVGMDDFLVLPNGETRMIVEVRTERDETGAVDHLEIYL